MKYIIEIDSKMIEDAKNGYVRLGEIADAVKTTATPYNPSGDCISRSALKEQINATDFDFGDYYDNTEEIRKRVCETIDNAQAVEPERPQGEWIKCGWSIRCSICNYDMPYTVRNFCPNCGADMRTKENLNG